MSELINTYFAPAKRSTVEELEEQKKYFQNQQQLTFFLDSVPIMYLILNENRQIIYANKTTLCALGINDFNTILGLRPGEAVNCVHAKEMTGGCGTSEACRYCGAVKAIISSIDNIPSIEECRIPTDTNSAFDLRVFTSPYEAEGKKFVIFSIVDISDEKRRRNLERIFFHDVLNIAGGIKGISAVIQENPEEINDFKDLLYDSSNQLMNEILTQRDITNAENNELSLHIVDVNSKKILNFLTSFYSQQELCKNKTIVANENCVNINFNTDEALLLRVLGNMTKNALEASDKGQTVTLNVNISEDKKRIIFSVHSQKFIPRKIQLQIFQRSFSTKGANRGLGTYSMKLLSEKYLKGKVSFISDEQFGTTFFGDYPINFE